MFYHYVNTEKHQLTSTDVIGVKWIVFNLTFVDIKEALCDGNKPKKQQHLYWFNMHNNMQIYQSRDNYVPHWSWPRLMMTTSGDVDQQDVESGATVGRRPSRRRKAREEAARELENGRKKSLEFVVLIVDEMVKVQDWCT